MDKARLTYRFDNNGNKINKTNESKKDIISLNENEFKVLKESDRTMNKDEFSDPILDSQPLNQFTTDYGAWSSPFDVETARLEQLIRETDTYQDNGYNKKHHERDRNDDLMERIDSQSEYSNTYQQNPYKNKNPYGYVKKTKRSWYKIITSFTGAVIVGIAFGFFVLSSFSDNQQSASTDDINQSEIDSISPLESDEIIKNESNMTSPQPVVNLNGALSLNLPTQTYFMLQNGMFENLEGANEAINGLSNNGFAAVSELNENYYVFAGMTSNRDDALSLGYKLQQDEFEIYIKTYEIPSIQQIKWNGNDTDLVQSYFSQGSDLVHTMNELTLIHLKDQSFTTFENNSLDTIKSLHQTWSALIPQINTGFPEEVKSNFEDMNRVLNNAMISLEEYQKNPSSSLLWQTQTALMQYTILQKDLLQTISVSL